MPEKYRKLKYKKTRVGGWALTCYTLKFSPRMAKTNDKTCSTKKKTLEEHEQIKQNTRQYILTADDNTK